MTSLYDQAPDVWNRIAETRPNTAELAKKMTSFTDMETALSYGPSVVCKWVSGASRVSMETERRARAYLTASRAVPQPSQAAQATPDSGGRLVMVACNSDQLAKLMKVAAVLGVEVIEV